MTQNHPQILTAGFVINGVCLIIIIAAIALSLFVRYPLVMQLRKLTLLPLIFLACTTVVYCLSSISVASVYAGCGPWDLTGRYVVPLVIGLPFMLAAVVTLLWFPTNEAQRQVKNDSISIEEEPGHPQGDASPIDEPSPHHISWYGRGIPLRMPLLIIVLLTYFSTIGYAYVKSSSHNTFQTSGCIAAPADATLIINYMMQQHIRYAIATGWVGDPLTFKTNGNILVTQDRNRVQSMSDTVLHSDRYSLLLFANHNDSNPPILQKMAARHITYRIRRFETVLGRDLMVITPLNQTVSPLDPYFKDTLQQIHDGC